jgi:hypothetical protein
MESITPPSRSPAAEQKRRRFSIIAALVVVTVVIVAISLIATFPATRNHIVCTGETRLGNVTAWYPFSFIAAPYNGSETGALLVWENYTVSGTYHNYTTRVPTNAASGDVTLGSATGGNWTIYSATNSTFSGPGRSDPCASSMIAFLGPPNGPTSEAWGGGTVASGLRIDAGLPSQFNASFRCSVINESSNCAVSSTFDLNFTQANGEVNTCGKMNPELMDVKGSQLAVRIPFSLNGSGYSIPIGPSPPSGMIGWFNYTFPADGGVWQYESLPGVDSMNSGLVFSYSPCP